jgi:hypothetical protein
MVINYDRLTLKTYLRSLRCYGYKMTPKLKQTLKSEIKRLWPLR